MQQCEMLYLSRFVFKPFICYDIQKKYFYTFCYVAYFKLPVRVWSAVQDELNLLALELFF